MILVVFSNLKYLRILNSSFFCHNYNMGKDLMYSIQVPGNPRKLQFYVAPNLMNFKLQQADLWTGYFSSSFHLFSSIYFNFIWPQLTTASQNHNFSLHFRTMIIFTVKKLVNSLPRVIACFSSLFLWIIKFSIVRSLYPVRNKGSFINWNFWYIRKQHSKLQDTE